MKTSLKERAIVAWKDPVGSKLISALIIFIIGSAWVAFSKYTFLQAYDVALQILLYKIPVYVFLSIVGIYYIVKLLKRLLKPKIVIDPIWDEQLGNYTFRDLFNLLSEQFLRVERLNKEDNILTTFLVYAFYLTKGITVDYPKNDYAYGFSLLCPRLMTFGLVTKTDTPYLEAPTVMETTYTLSENGYKFLASLEKVFYKDPALYRKILDHKFIDENHID